MQPYKRKSKIYKMYRYHFRKKMLYYIMQTTQGGVLDSLGEAVARVARRDSTWSRKTVDTNS